MFDYKVCSAGTYNLPGQLRQTIAQFDLLIYIFNVFMSNSMSKFKLIVKFIQQILSDPA